MSIHVALLGDSSFDNRTYTRGEPDVAAHLRDVLGAGTNVTLLAIDGSTTTDMGMQLDRVRDDMTHLVLSIGGNDVVEALAALRRELVVCTIYNGNLPPPEGPRARVALRMFNDDVCSAVEDFANPIEPSGRGGRKIAQAIALKVFPTRSTTDRFRGASR